MKRSLTAAVAGVALAGLIGAGVAVAADGTGPAGRLADALSALVGNGTITQEQADKVSKALTDSWEQERAERDADRAERQAEIDALLQKTLKMDSEEVRAKIAEGETLLDIAGESAEALADGMVNLIEQHLDEAVADGRITQDQAKDTLARARTRADAWLAGEESAMGGGMGRDMGLALLFGPGMGAEGGMGPGGGMGAEGGMGAGPGMGGPGGGMGHRGGGGRGPGAWGGDVEDDQTESSGSTASATSWQV